MTILQNEAEEVVSSTTASVDSPRSAGLRQLVPRPTSSQANRDLAKVVGQVVYFDQFDEVRHFKERLQIRPKVMRRDEGADSGSPASSTPVQTPSPNSLSSAGQRPHDVLLLNREDIPLKDRLSECLCPCGALVPALEFSSGFMQLRMSSFLWVKEKF